jgi:hypothetical protein
MLLGSSRFLGFRNSNMRRQIMRFQPINLLVALPLVVAASSAFAETIPVPMAGPVPVPGPIAGAGLGYLALAGGYYLVRRGRKPKSGE